MSTPTLSLEITNYAAAVRAELEDLDATERDDLLEELEQHLQEVAAEGDGSLIDRLGEPSAYAAELRASAGLSPRESRTKPSRIRGVFRAMRDIPGVQAAIDFLPELRPGWWVFRAYVLVMGLDIVFTHHSMLQFPGVPSFDGAPLFGVLAVIAFIPPSVALGRASLTSASARRISILVSAATIFLALVSLGRIGNEVNDVQNAVLNQEPTVSGVLAHADGSPIQNICAYAPDLKPIPRVLLFDQDGRAIDNLSPPDVVSDSGESPVVSGFANLYPRPMQVADPATGTVKSFNCPTLASPPPPTPAPTP